MQYTAGAVRLSDLPTPAVLVDQPTFERNIQRMQDAADARGVRLRPHAKTHKSPDLAALQIARGAVGICCAKLGEAEVFADAGVRDIRLPYPLHPVNGPRLLPLLDRTHLSFIVDSEVVAQGWSAVMRQAGKEVDVLVKVDVGFHRCGIDPEPEGAAAVVARIAGLPGLRFRGLLSHAGQAYAAASADEIASIADGERAQLFAIRDRLDAEGVPVREMSVGSTPTARFSVALPGITELRPGNYVYYDRMQVALGSAAWEDCALTVLARVVSRPSDGWFVLDAGSKTLSSDQLRGGARLGFGAILSPPDATVPDDGLLIERLSEEHATVRVTRGGCTLQPGDLVRVVPNHSCVVSNLVDEAWVTDGQDVLDRLQIAARGRIA